VAQADRDQGVRADGYPVAFSPGGTKILFKRTRRCSKEVYLMNADGSDQTNPVAFRPRTLRSALPGPLSPSQRQGASETRHRTRAIHRPGNRDNGSERPSSSPSYYTKPLDGVWSLSPLPAAMGDSEEASAAGGRRGRGWME